jgi:hypothetical protein
MSMYPWIRITLIQNNEVFCIINIDFKLQLVLFYVSAFHIFMNIFTFRHYRQNEQLYFILLTDLH